MKPSIRLAAVIAAALVATPQPAAALTISLDFVPSLVTDIFGVGTTVTDFAPYGFTALTVPQIQYRILDAVIDDFLHYPTIGADALSPLPVGKQLGIGFVMSTTLGLPTNGDSEFYRFAIGNNTTADGFFGVACYTCVRNASGVKPNFGIALGAFVGSILVNNIAGLAGLAASDDERINLIAGTVSHEIGHALALDHNGILANPGESAYSLLGTGASPSSMPSGERVKDRAFAYADFDILIGAIGLVDVPAEQSVPEPAAGLLVVAIGGLVVVLRRRAGQRATSRPAAPLAA